MRRAMSAWLLLACACSRTASTPSPPPAASDHLPPGVRAAVLQHHNDASRSGVYTDASLTREAARHLRFDTAFNAPLQGGVYAQPLYWDGGEGGQDLLIVATQRNEIIAKGRVYVAGNSAAYAFTVR